MSGITVTWVSWLWLDFVCVCVCLFIHWFVSINIYIDLVHKISKKYDTGPTSRLLLLLLLLCRMHSQHQWVPGLRANFSPCEQGLNCVVCQSNGVKQISNLITRTFISFLLGGCVLAYRPSRTWEKASFLYNLCFLIHKFINSFSLMQQMEHFLQWNIAYRNEKSRKSPWRLTILYKGRNNRVLKCDVDILQTFPLGLLNLITRYIQL